MRVSQIVIAVCMGFIVPASVGYLSGWLVGSSQTPVVATVIPLVFGLLGIAGIGTATKWFTATSIIETVFNKAGSERRSPQLNAELEEAAGDIVRWPAMVTLSIATLIFCLAFFVGVDSGIKLRVPKYPPLTDELENLKLRPYEAAALSRLRIDWLASGIQHSDFQILIQQSFIPIFQKYPVGYPDLFEGQSHPEDSRYEEFHFVLTAARGQSKGPGGSGGPEMAVPEALRPAPPAPVLPPPAVVPPKPAAPAPTI